MEVGQRALPGFRARNARADALDELFQLGDPLFDLGQAGTLLLVLSMCHAVPPRLCPVKQHGL